MTVQPLRTASIRVGLIHVPKRMRASVDQERVGAMAESMEQIGLMTPITVFEGEHTADDGEVYSGPILVAGHHRLLAAQKLGWPSIECIVSGADEYHRLVWEIDENLARAELTTEEKREHIRRRKEIWDGQKKAQAEKSGKSFPTLGRGAEGFATETARATGLSKRRVNQLAADPKPAAAAKASCPSPSSPTPSQQQRSTAGQVGPRFEPIRDAIADAAANLGPERSELFRLLRRFIDSLEQAEGSR